MIRLLGFDEVLLLHVHFSDFHQCLGTFFRRIAIFTHLDEERAGTCVGFIIECKLPQHKCRFRNHAILTLPGGKVEHLLRSLCGVLPVVAFVIRKRQQCLRLQSKITLRISVDQFLELPFGLLVLILVVVRTPDHHQRVIHKACLGMILQKL